MISVEVIDDLRTFIPSKKQSMFVEQAITKELKRTQFQNALEKTAGTWKKKDHPEKTASFIRSLRESKRT